MYFYSWYFLIVASIWSASNMQYLSIGKIMKSIPPTLCGGMMSLINNNEIEKVRGYTTY
ncbi:hypothetical protein BvCmsOUNP037_02182 [Escherichia coli]|nr:hypothetical protein BvCmsOUNP037_02182 [Escherichia coli]GDU42768.1 hypothetical protein BvCmsSINP033_03776 [Escherichia coli]